MAEGAVIQERDSTIVESNLSAERVLGLTRDQLLGRTSFDPRWQLIREDGSDLPPEEQPSMRCLSTGRSVADQLLGLRLPSGELRRLRVSSQPFFKDGDVAPFRTATTFVDVTAQFEAANQLALKSDDLAKALLAAESANEAKSNFLANMSHEIRTPLNAIIGTVAVMEHTELTPTQREMVRLIMTAGANLEGILTDILDLSKIEADRLNLQEEPFELEAELARIGNSFAVQAETKGISFSTTFGAGCSAVVLGDIKRIRQIIGNMLANAVKFTEAGSVELRVGFLERAVGERISGLYVDVQDTGIGIEPDALSRIFDRFSQADETITRRFGGTGLGLTISRTLAKLMGGSIGVVSRPGEGSTFTFYAPLRRSELSGQPLESMSAPEMMTGPPRKVLVAEDNPANQKMMTLMLQAVGAEIILAQDGADAVTKYRNSDVDCILMDIHMPIKDGLTAISEIRQFEMTTGRSRTPIAIFTADTGAQRLTNARLAGADAALLKPITVQKLIECLGTLQALAATDPDSP
jgi:signal transduction histidine kinase/ActR/RegA family two-component response regulator